MYSVVLVIHVILAISLIGLILIQKPEGGALGALGGGDNMSFLSGRAAGNFLTKTTSIFAVMFIITSLTLAFIAKGTSKSSAIVSEKPIVAETVKDEPAAAAKEDENRLKAPPKPEKKKANAEKPAAPKAPISKE